jgi:hypothetical protein
MTILDFLNNASSLAGLAGSVASVAVWAKLKLDEKKALEEVKVLLKLAGTDGGIEVNLPLNIIRKDVSRAEILGRMGMIPMKEKGKRFALKGLFSPDFIKQVNAVARGESNQIIIPATKAELEQFDI